MSDFSEILAKVRTNLMQKGVRYGSFTATSAGASDGTTVISTGMIQLDDAWNGCDCVLSSGERKKVVDFTASSDMLDFTGNPFPFQVALNTRFELFEPGTWKGDDIKRAVIEAATKFVRLAPRDLQENFIVRETIGSNLGTVDLPANVMRYEEPKIRIDGKKVDILSPERHAYLDNAGFIDPVNGDYIGYFAGRSDENQNVGEFKFKPAHNQDCEFTFIPKPVFDTSQNWKVPEEMWEPIAFGATQILLMANEMVELSSGWEKEMFTFLPGKELEN